MKIGNICVYQFWSRFEINALVFPARPIGYIAHVLIYVHEKLWSFHLEKFGSQKFHGLEQMKIGKICVYQLWGSFKLKNTLVFPTEQIGYIANVLANIYEKSIHFVSVILDHRNSVDYSTRKSKKIVFTCFGDHLNLKRAYFSRETNSIHCQLFNRCT